VAFDYVASAAFFGDGKLLIGGGFAQVDGSLCAGVAAVRGYDLDATRPPQFNNIVRASDGTVRLNLSTEPGVPLILQVSSDLVEWVSVTTNYFPAGTVEYLDSQAVSSGQRFYRSFRLPSVPFPNL